MGPTLVGAIRHRSGKGDALSVGPRGIAGKTRRRIAAMERAELVLVDAKIKTPTRRAQGPRPAPGSRLMEAHGVGPVVASASSRSRRRQALRRPQLTATGGGMTRAGLQDTRRAANSPRPALGEAARPRGRERLRGHSSTLGPSRLPPGFVGRLRGSEGSAGSCRSFSFKPMRLAARWPAARLQFGSDHLPLPRGLRMPNDDVSMNGGDTAKSVAAADRNDRTRVHHDRGEIREFVRELSVDDIKSGGWFSKLLAQSLRTYTEEVDWRYFQDRYKGLPPDAIVEQRIKMASRYAAIEGGLSASAYTGAIVATLGTRGRASPATVPAAVGTLMVDLAYTTRLQLHLAYDISVLYRVPLDTTNPDDLWKLIRVALTIKNGEVVTQGVLKTVPAMMRPVIKRFYSKEVLNAAKGLPFVGKYLLQRNAIKVAIPLAGVPLGVLLNRQTTLIAGRHAREVFRNEAHTIEVAKNLTKQTKHPECLLWVAWLVIMADEKTSEDEANLMRHLVSFLEEHHRVVDDDLAHLITLDREEVWQRLATEDGDKSDLVSAAEKIAAIDGRLSSREHAVIAEIKRHCEAS